VRDRVGWVRDRVAVFLWSKQREILEAVVRHRYVAVKSAHDTGTGPRRLSRCGVAARYERRPVCDDNCRRPSRSTRFCGVHRPGSSQGQPSWPRHGRWRVATEAGRKDLSRLITINRRSRGFMR
jgi:hypothetical protein